MTKQIKKCKHRNCAKKPTGIVYTTYPESIEYFYICKDCGHRWKGSEMQSLVRWEYDGIEAKFNNGNKLNKKCHMV